VCKGSETKTDWIECDRCLQWFHQICVDVENHQEGEPWMCETCKMVLNLDPLGTKKQEDATAALLDVASGGVHTESQVTGELMKLIERAQAREAEAKEENEALKKQFQAQQENFEMKLERLKRFISSSKEHEEKPTGAVLKPNHPISLRKKEEEDAILASVKRFKQIDLENESQRSIVSGNRKSQGSEGSQSSGRETEIVQFSKFMKVMMRRDLEDLPKFSGKTREWPFFEAVYIRTTEEGNYSDHANVRRLAKALQGDAKSFVKNLLAYGSSGEEIMNALRRRFGKTSELLKELTNELTQLPTINNLSDPKFEEFALKLSHYVAELKSMKFDEQLKNEFLETLLIEKLVRLPSLYARWMDKRKSARPRSKNIEEFAEFILQQWERLPPSTDGESNSLNNDQLKQKVSTSSEPNRVMRHSVERPARFECPCCDESHLLLKCLNFTEMPVGERWEIAKSRRLCFACLKTCEHRADDCPEKRVCHLNGCKASHHRLLHANRRTPTIGTNPRQGAIRASTSSLHPDAQEFVPERFEESRTAQVGQMSIEAFNMVHEEFQLTAKVVAVRIHGSNGSFFDTYAFLDDGSSITLMDQEIFHALQPQRYSVHNLKLKWTGDVTREEPALRCDVKISGSNGPHQYPLQNVYCVKDLNLEETSQNGTKMRQRYRHLRNLPLPDFVKERPRRTNRR
jgi:Protein of unknown function (DUF1759)/PHD-finger